MILIVFLVKKLMLLKSFKNENIWYLYGIIRNPKLLL